MIVLNPSSESWLALLHNVVLAAAPLALVIVAVRSASRRAVVVERLLTAAGGAAAVETVLREELRDPTLRIRFELDGDWVSTDGATSAPGADDDGVGTQRQRDPDAPGRMTRVILRKRAPSFRWTVSR